MKDSKVHFAARHSFFAYRLPHEQQVKLCIGLNEVSQTKAQLVISTFAGIETYYSYENCVKDVEFSFTPYGMSKQTATTFKEYSLQFKETMKLIEQGTLNKMVLSKVAKSEWAGGDIYPLFKALTEDYGSAFVFCYHTPDRGCWMGATPELLLQKKANGNYHTMALAGTQDYDEIPLDQVRWSSKEKVEQGYLTKFIDKILKEKSIAFDQLPTTTVRAGQVVHICTNYVIAKPPNMSLYELSGLLHPGPAIGGFPKKEALHFIATIEKHSRQDYCGYLGILEDSPKLYINLRCMRVFSDECELFLGSGITIDSEVKDEWMETETKSKTMKSILYQLVHNT